MRYLIQIFFFVSLVISAVAQPVLPATPIKTNTPVTLAWDASPTTNVTHYFIRRGDKSGAYTDMIRVNGRTNLTVIWTNVVASSTNYFIATAANDANLESDPSNEISYVAPSRPIGIPFRSAIPLTAKFEWMKKDGSWQEINIDFGPYYVLTDDTNSMVRVKMFTGTAIPVLPK